MTDTPNIERYRIGDLILDLKAYRLTRGDEELTLPKLSFDLLATLAARSPSVTTIPQLMDEVWGEVVVGEETVVQRVKLLREALRESGNEAKYIETVRSRGYKLAVPVERVPDQVTATDRSSAPPASLIGELQRRRVLQVGGAYVVVAWITLQVADIVLPELSLPPWTMRLVLVMLIAGFPIALILTWAFQVTPAGVVRDAGPDTRRTSLLLGAGALLVGLTLGGVWWQSTQRESRLVSPGSARGVAVLPFRDMSREGDQAYFSDGIHEELLSRLAELRVFRVPSRTSVEVYRETKKNTREIAQELRVDAVLEGSVRHSQGRVRVTVQLIDGHSDDHLWSQDYDRELSMENLFGIQRDLANQIAKSLNAELSPDQGLSIDRMPTANLAAYDAYLKAFYHYRLYNATDLRKAVEYFERATQLDPLFGAAWSGLANAYAFAATGYGWLEPEEGMRLAKEYSAKALELAPTHPATVSLLGDILFWYEWDWRGAEREYLRALESNPRHVGNRLSYAYLLSSRNRHDEAIEQIERCIELDPRSPRVQTNAAWRYMNARQYDRVIEHADIALSIDPRFLDALISRSYALMLSGRVDQALTDLQTARVHAEVLGFALAMSGRKDEAREQLERIVTPLPGERHFPGSAAIVSIGLGEYDQAFEWLERAVQDRHREVLLLDAWEVYDPLRGDPRFDELLKRIGLGQVELGTDL